MSIKNCLLQNQSILMEGALGERLKREYHLAFDDKVAMANLVYTKEGQDACMIYGWNILRLQVTIIFLSLQRRQQGEPIKKE